MNGRNILGMVPMSGVRRAADMESAAMARCTTRKFVHQYPKLNTNPSPATMPNSSTPMGFWLALPIYFQECVILAGRRETMPCHPPALAQASIARGANPATIRKNCSTSL